jgi:hypothetical protein
LTIVSTFVPVGEVGGLDQRVGVPDAGAAVVGIHARKALGRKDVGHVEDRAIGKNTIASPSVCARPK